MTFDEWFNEIEGFGLRSERFYSEIDPDSRTDGQALVSWLRAAYDIGAEHAQTYKDGYDAAMRIVKSTYADKFPNTYFIHGDLGEVDENGLPNKIMIVPAYGVDWFQIYEKTNETHGPEY